MFLIEKTTFVSFLICTKSLRFNRCIIYIDVYELQVIEVEDVYEVHTMNILDHEIFIFE